MPIYSAQNSEFWGEDIIVMINTATSYTDITSELWLELNSKFGHDTTIITGDVSFIEHTNFKGIKSILFLTTSVEESEELSIMLHNTGFWIDAKHHITVDSIKVSSVGEVIKKIEGKRNLISNYEGE